jgi:DNA-binding FrmR family transcriptional regulator
MERELATGESSMWIKAAAPERVAELFHNHEKAPGICGKGSESGSWNESAQLQSSPMTRAADSGLESAKSHGYFSRPGEAEWAAKLVLPEISKEKQKLLSRIKRLGAQIDAVQHSVTESDECTDILMLVAAIRDGVNSLIAEILEDHIRLHITHPNRGTESSKELTEDVIGLVRAYLK